MHHVRCAEAVIVNADDPRWCLDDDAHLVMVLAAGSPVPWAVEPASTTRIVPSGSGEISSTPTW